MEEEQIAILPLLVPTKLAHLLLPTMVFSLIFPHFLSFSHLMLVLKNIARALQTFYSIPPFFGILQEQRDTDQHQEQWENPPIIIIINIMDHQLISVNPIPISQFPLTQFMGKKTKNLHELHFPSGFFFFFSFHCLNNHLFFQFSYSGYPQELYAMVSSVLPPSFSKLIQLHFFKAESMVYSCRTTTMRTMGSRFHRTTPRRPVPVPVPVPPEFTTATIRSAAKCKDLEFSISHTCLSHTRLLGYYHYQLQLQLQHHLPWELLHLLLVRISSLQAMLKLKQISIEEEEERAL